MERRSGLACVLEATTKKFVNFFEEKKGAPAEKILATPMVSEELKQYGPPCTRRTATVPERGLEGRRTAQTVRWTVIGDLLCAFRQKGGDTLKDNVC